MRTSTATVALVGAFVASLLVAPLITAQPAGPGSLRGAELLSALRGGGFILYFRHADTDHRQHDIPGQAPQDCAKQRNLTDRGRDHARSQEERGEGSEHQLNRTGAGRTILALLAYIRLFCHLHHFVAYSLYTGPILSAPTRDRRAAVPLECTSTCRLAGDTRAGFRYGRGSIRV